MSTLPRANGAPEPNAARIAQQIHDYATMPTSVDVECNEERVRGLHHILDTAHDALRIALAIVNARGPGKISYREAERRIGLHKDTVREYVHQGKAILGSCSDRDQK